VRFYPRSGLRREFGGIKLIPDKEVIIPPGVPDRSLKIATGKLGLFARALSGWVPVLKIKPRSLQIILMWCIISSGLAVVFLDKVKIAFLPFEITLIARTVFWIAVIFYFWLRLSGKLSRKSQ
jgi:hypothetical protein